MWYDCFSNIQAVDYRNHSSPCDETLLVAVVIVQPLNLVLTEQVRSTHNPIGQLHSLFCFHHSWLNLQFTLVPLFQSGIEIPVVGRLPL